MASGKKKSSLDKLKDASEMLWACLANVSNGDWSKQSKEWQKYTRRWRDNYFKTLKEISNRNPIQRISEKLSNGNNKKNTLP